MNTDAFVKKNLSFAGYESNPAEDGSLMITLLSYL